MENFLNNGSFFLLLCAMSFYWIRAFFNVSFFLFLGKFAIIAGNFTLFFLLIFRGLNEHHFPLSNPAIKNIVTEIQNRNNYKILLEKGLSDPALIGAIFAPTALFLNAFASFQLPESLQKLSPLIPALQSNWLMMHVTVMLLSYTTLISASLLAIAFLILFENPKQVLTTSSSKKIGLLNQLDQLSFRGIGIGFALLTVGILSGSVWANEAWGSYWSWDPKETWSFVTWLVFAIYLHLRLTRNWSGWKSAVLATIGFFIVWVCFLGVNFLAKGLHSYGWLS
uniref:Cytochrome c biogenesis protein CcsA n=1 Tax=Pseudocodium devriesii TaxID=453070 RepID=A0A386B142_9CHLO|nr:cytochrome c biogenesis protein ccs1 [Pseudocodium devriesii]AYC65363.1 cytochrome c biogenesis protein ccs1 [Pseudocodium devriesii]